MREKSALVMLVDGLSPRFLASQGNTWIDTPNLNWLASVGQTFETAIADSTELQTGLRSFFAGVHSAFIGQRDSYGNLLEQLTSHGIETHLITDDVTNETQSGLTDAFDKVVSIDCPSDLQAADSIGQTHLASCFAQVMSELATGVPPYLCVVVLTSLARIWDAPYAGRLRFVEQDDPPPPEIVRPPLQKLDLQKVDPDDVLGISRAYAAQVELFDRCWGALVNELRDLGLLEDIFIGLTAPRSYPLGEHGVVGNDSTLLFSEATQVPLIVRIPRSEMESARHQSIVQPSQLMPTVMDWFGAPCGKAGDTPLRESLWPLLVTGQSGSQEFAVLLNEERAAIWTPVWMLVDDGVEPFLFVKPDDRWEVNPVGSRCFQIVEKLREQIDGCRRHVDDRSCFTSLPLADELKFGLL